MTKPEWGTKRSCDSCGKRFYDLKRSPIVCPQCGTTITARKLPTKTPKAAAPAVEVKPKKPALAAKLVKVDGDDAWSGEEDAVDADEDVVGDIEVDVEEDDDDLDDDEAEDLLVDASDLDEDEDEIDVVKVRGNDAGDD